MRAMDANAPSSDSEADAWLKPGLGGRIAQNFFTHSGHVPLTLLILEWMLAPGHYLLEIDPYLLVGVGLSQAIVIAMFAARGPAWLFFGNLVGPLSYSLIESGIEGFSFFGQWHHQAYWAFALAFGTLQWLEARLPRPVEALVLLENILRSLIPLAMYALFEARDGNSAVDLGRFFEDRAHIYLAIVLLLVGSLLGIADLTLRRSQATIRRLAQRLRRYSEWSLGREVLARAMADEGTLGLQRVDRAVLFMDIRGFTRWAEAQPPEAVVAMLNKYYAAAEEGLHELRPVKLKFTADEAMAVFASATEAVAVARRWLAMADALLAPLQLGVGSGLHWGPVVEGVLGGSEARAYDVIGDTVNTASRLCGSAAAGELLVSAAALAASGADGGDWRDLAVKGKRDPLRVCTLAT